MSKENQKRLRRTILLGAGASRASKYALPIIDDFFGPDLYLHTDLVGALGRFGRKPSECNLEYVLSNLDLSRKRIERWNPGMKALYCGQYAREYDDCIHYIGRRLNIGAKDPDPLHLRLFRGLQPGENVLTMNYDLVADQALTRAEEDETGRLPQRSRMGKIVGLVGQEHYAAGPQPPGLTKDELVGGFYIKLHGSLDWLRCATTGCFGSIVYFPSGQSPLSEFHTSWTPCRYCGGSLEPAIIPPSAGKLIDERGKWSFLWHLAWMSLEWAEEWVFVGLSMAFTDFDLAWLLRYSAEHNSFLRQIYIVNPDPSVVERIGRTLYPREVAMTTFRCLEDYLDFVEARTNPSSSDREPSH